MLNSIFKRFYLILFLAFASISIYSDVDTTSSLKGNVNVPGASVIVEHIPTGFTKATTSGSEGNFSLVFLPVGGPYAVTVSAPGFNSEKLQGLYLKMAKSGEISVTLKKAAADEIVVTAQAGSGVFKVGTGTLLTRDDIDAVPTINRSVADFAKLDPRVSINSASSRDTQISVMGANNRFNDFSIDGVSFNDPFGLNANGFGTMRNPVSIDFIDQISIDVTPYDVSRGNTTGGSIAVVTKSGSNDFHGSVYYSERNEDNVGEDPNGNDFPEFEEETTTLTFSGPIIKDRLFFFVGYEDFEKALPALYGTADSNAQNKLDYATAAIADEIKTIALNTYGYDAGRLNGITFPETHEEYTVKINAVINDFHRGVLNISSSESDLPQDYGVGHFSNNWYRKPVEIDRSTVTLYSDWTNKFSTKIKYTNYEMEEDDGSMGDDLFPEVTVEVCDPSNSYNCDDIILGGDRYRGANFINVESDYFTFKGTYDAGESEFTFGYEREETDVYNLFIARYNGEVHFDSVADFQAGEWGYLRFQTPLAGNAAVDSVAAKFSIEKDTFYVQSKWYANDGLTVTFGLRYDSVTTPDTPLLNPNFLARNGVPNNAAFDFDLLQPRMQFNYDATNLFNNDKITSATIRGGRGLFLGRIPNVWYSNAYTRSGGLTDYNRFRSYSSTIGNMPAASVADPKFFWLGPTSNYQVRSAWFGDAQGTDPDFQAPSSWRSNIALDVMLSSGWDLTLEYNVDEIDKGVFYRDLGLRKDGTLLDGRGVYNTARSDYWLTNDDQGDTEALTISASTEFENGVKFMAAYTAMDASDVYGLTSSQAESSYNYMPRWDGENMDAARTSFMSEHKFLATLDYTAQLIGSNDTRFSLVYIAKSGEPYSVLFDDPNYWVADGINGTAFYSDNALAYIPSGQSDPKVNFSSPAVADEVMALVNSTALSSYKGTYAPRNAFDSPWLRRLDLRITQDINLFNDHKVVVYLDVLNLLNMIDDEQGIVKEYNFNVSKQILVNGSTDGKFNISGTDPDDNFYVRNLDAQSAWSINLGFAYKF